MHEIEAIAGIKCGIDGICSTGSRDVVFKHSVNAVIAWWSLGCTPGGVKHAFGLSFQGYIPSDHPANGYSSAYFQRPALDS